MCNHCIDIARYTFEHWPADQQRIAKLALRENAEATLPSQEYVKARDHQLAKDAETYRTHVTPHRAQLLAAVEQAEEMARNGREAGVVLDVLLTNVRTDAAAIPATLPI